MKLLVLDTCGVEASVALAEGGMVMAQENLPGRSASERLLTVVRELLEGAGWRLGELGAIGVVHGPGSFTGVRVGVSAAKGLSEASGVPLVAVSRLEVLARVARGAVVALDAGRGEFYVREDGVESLRTRADLAGLEVVMFEAEAAFEGARIMGMPRAADALAIVTERVLAGAFEDAAALDANYVRRSEGLYGRASG